jgi:hypothetical protein
LGLYYRKNEINNTEGNAEKSFSKGVLSIISIKLLYKYYGYGRSFFTYKNIIPEGEKASGILNSVPNGEVRNVVYVYNIVKRLTC